MNRKALYLLLLIPAFAICLKPSIAQAATITSTATGGTWSTGSTWVGGVVPGTSDTVIIATTGANAVNLNAKVWQTSAGSVTVNSGATLNIASAGTFKFGSFTVNTGGTATIRRALTVLGSTTIAGTVNFGSTNSTAKAMKFTGPVTLNSGAVWTEPGSGNGVTNTYTFQNNFTNNATTFNALGTGIHTFSGTGKTISGSTATVINKVASTGSVTNNSTLTVNTALSGTGTLINSSTGILNLGGTTTVTTLNTTASGNTVNYTGTAQTVKAVPYYNLTLLGSGAKSIGLGSSVSGYFSIAPTGTATASIAAGTTLNANALKLGGITQSVGTWGSTSSSATNKTNSYFAATTGIVNVSPIYLTVTNVTSTASNATYKTAAVIPIQVKFSGTVYVTGTPTLTLETGFADEIVNYSSGSGTDTLTFNYTVQDGDNTSDLDYQSTSALQLNGGTIIDAFSNSVVLTLPAPAASGSLGANMAIVIDTLAPTITSISSATPDGTYSAGQTVSADLTFSEPVTSTGTVVVTFDTNRTCSFVVSASTSASCNYTVEPGDNSVDLNVNSVSGVINDAILNTMTNFSPSVNLSTNKAIVIDTLGPTVTNVTSTNANGAYKTGDIIGIQVTFSEAVNVTGIPQLTILTGSPTTTTIDYVSGSGTDTLLFNYTVASGNNSDQLDYASVNALANISGSTIVDAFLNAATLSLPASGTLGSFTANKSIAIVTATPSVVLSSTASSITNAPIAVTATFSTNVYNFTEQDIAVVNGTIGDFSGIGNAYTFTLTPIGQGAVSVSVDSAVAQDIAGNLNSASNQLSYTFDNISPTVSVTTDIESPTTISPIPYKATFSEAVTGFDLSDVFVVNASTNNFKKISSTVYTFDVYPVTDHDQNTDVYVWVETAKAADLAGNNNTASDSGTPAYISFDNHNPTVNIASSVADNFNSSTIPVTATFSEDVTGFSSEKINVTNGTVENFSGSGSIYTFDVVPLAQGQVTISIPEAAAQDAAATDNLGSNLMSFVYDTIAPTAEITTTATSPTKSSSYLVTATFSESINNFAINDISIINGSASNLTGSGSSYEFTVTPNNQGYVAITIAQESFSDAAANFNTGASNTIEISYDSIAPTLAEVTPIPVLSNNLTPSYTFSASEGGNISYGGSCSSVTSTAILGNNTITLNQLANGTFSNCSVTVTDESGNASSSLLISAFTINTVAPTVNTLIPANNAINVLPDANLIINFSKTVIAASGNIRIKKISDNSTVETIGVTDPKVTGSGSSIVTINPSTVLESQTSYFVEIDSTAFIDVYGNNYAGISGNNSWKFTSKDIVAPILTAKYPEIAAIRVPVDPKLELTFSENVLTNSGYITIRTVADNSIVDSINIAGVHVTGSGTNKISVTPTVTLSGLTDYYIQVGSTAITDLSGNYFAGVSDSSWHFTTVDTTNPHITVFSPANYATGVSTTANLVMTFDRVVYTQTGNIYIKKSIDNSIIETIDVTNGSKVAVSGTTETTVTINPATVFESQTSYYVQIDADSYNDLDTGEGNTFEGILDSTSWTFTTLDNITPTLSNVAISSNNSTSSSYAKVGNTVSLSFASSETITAPIVTFSSGGLAVANGVTVSNPSGNNWTATYTTSNSDTAGSITFSIGSFSDSSGNAGSAVTTGSGSVTFDKTAPTLTNVSIASNNSNPVYAKIGDTVTLSFTASEQITPPTVSFVSFSSGGTYVTNSVAILNPSSNNWTASYITSTSDASGVITYNISGYYDAAGNIGSNVTSGAGSVTFDKTIPSISNVFIATNNISSAYAKTGSTVTVSFTSSEAITSPTVTFRSGGSLITNSAIVANTSGNNWTASYVTSSSDTAGSVTFSIGGFYDTVGNAGSSVTSGSGAVTFDKTLPTLSSVVLYSNNSNPNYAKTGSTVVVTFTASETVTNPSVTFRSGGNLVTNSVVMSNISGNNWSGSYITSSSDTAGAITYVISGFTDIAGNTGSNVTSGSGSLTLDNTTPTLSNVSISSNNANSAYAKTGNAVTLSFTVSETVAAPSVTIRSGGNLVTNAVTVSNPSANNWTATYLTSSSDSVGNVTYSISNYRDTAGNTGLTVTTGSGSVTFDKNNPTLSNVTVSSNNSNSSYAKVGNTVSVNFTSNETITTPTVTFRSGGVLVTNSVVLANPVGNSWVASYIVNAADTVGSVTFLISNFRDQAGNNGATVSSGSGSVIIDKNAPSITNVSISSNNANSTLAEAGDLISIRFSSSETITSPTVNVHINGILAYNNTAQVSHIGNSWSATYTVDPQDIAGAVTFNINSYNDWAGNDGSAVTTGLGSVRVVVRESDPPTAPGDLQLASRGVNTVILNFGNASADSNFMSYRVYYKQGNSDVGESDSVFDSSTLPALGYINYNGATGMQISGLQINTQYVANIWAYDLFGNKSKAATELVFSTGESTPPSAPGDLKGAFVGQTDMWLRLGTSSSDPNFAHYKVYIKEGTGTVTESDSAIDSANQPILGFSTFNNSTVLRISNLTPGTQYTANIWAYDQFGNKNKAQRNYTFTTQAAGKIKSTLTNLTDAIKEQTVADTIQDYGLSITNARRIQIKQDLEATEADSLSSSSDIVIPQGTVMAAYDSNNQETAADFTTLEFSNSADVTNFPKYPVGVVRFGLPNKKIVLDKAITLNIDTPNVADGTTFDVYTKEDWEEQWSQLLVENTPVTCTVTSGICPFQTVHLSDFGVGQDTPPPDPINVPEFTTKSLLIILLAGAYMFYKKHEQVGL